MQQLDTPFWHAEFHPERAGNMTRLQHRPSGTELVRTPPDDATYLKQPEVWGVPVLFPPNRTPEGRFTFQGRTYQMPINEDGARNLHGVIMALPWDCQLTDNTAILTLHHKASSIWPHDFTMILKYEFEETRVSQTLTITNDSPETMPLFVGFHTAFPMPPSRTIRLTCPDWRYRLAPPHKTPDGTRLPMQFPAGFFHGGQGPALDDHFLVEPDATGFRGAEICCPAEKTIYRYELGAEWKYWMCWNHSGKHDFFCAEPMSATVDAFHSPEPQEISGLLTLAPGASQVFTASFSIQPLPESQHF